MEFPSAEFYAADRPRVHVGASPEFHLGQASRAPDLSQATTESHVRGVRDDAIANQLWNVSPSDPLTLGAVIELVASAALVASYIPRYGRRVSIRLSC